MFPSLVRLELTHGSIRTTVCPSVARQMTHQKAHLFILFATETSASSSNGRLRSMPAVVWFTSLRFVLGTASQSCPGVQSCAFNLTHIMQSVLFHTAIIYISFLYTKVNLAIGS